MGRTNLTEKVFIAVTILLLGCFLLSGCAGDKALKQRLTLRDLLRTYSGKEIAISVWNASKSKAEVSTYLISEVKYDYMILKGQDERQQSIAIPFHDITSIILSDTPPTVVLNEQTLLTGFGETIDNIGYLGSRLERIRQQKTE